MHGWKPIQWAALPPESVEQIVDNCQFVRTLNGSCFLGQQGTRMDILHIDGVFPGNRYFQLAVSSRTPILKVDCLQSKCVWPSSWYPMRSAMSISGDDLAFQWQHAWHARVLNSLWMVCCTGSLQWLSEARQCSSGALGSSSCWAQHVGHHSIKQAQRRICRQLSCAQACSLRPATSTQKQTKILTRTA